MKQKMISRTIYILLILCCVGLCIYGIVINKADPKEEIVKFSFVVAGCIIGFARNEMRNGLEKLSDYEESYGKIIGGAFSNDKRARKKLLRAIRVFDYEQYRKAAKAFRALKARCIKEEDYLGVVPLLATSYSRQYLYYPAIREYEDLISKQIESGRIYNNLANMYSAVNEKDKAREYYERAASRYPEYEYSFLNLASHYFEEKDYDTAIMYAKRALDINRKLILASDLLAIIYALLEDQEMSDKYVRLSIASGGDTEQLREAIEYHLMKRDEEYIENEEYTEDEEDADDEE